MLERPINAELLKYLTDRLIKDEEQYYNTSPKSWDEEIKNFTCLIDSIPTMEVKPIIQAQWKPKDIMLKTPFARNYYCSNCKYEPLEYKNFCPNCGALMEKIINNE